MAAVVAEAVPGETICLAEGVHANAACLLEFLESKFEEGVSLDQLFIPWEVALPLTPELWAASLLSNNNPEEERYRLLHSQWSRSHEQHLKCRRSLSESKDLFHRLLCFLSDLLDYDSCKAAQARMDYLVPTVSTLFDSPIYFSKQEKHILESFTSPNGQAVSQAVSNKFGRRPYFQDVCTSHVLAPFLMRLFCINNDCFSNKEFKDFRKSFNGEANRSIEKSRPVKASNNVKASQIIAPPERGKPVKASNNKKGQSQKSKSAQPSNNPLKERSKKRR